MNLTLKTLLLTTALAFSPLMAADYAQPIQETTQQTITLAFTKNDQRFEHNVQRDKTWLSLSDNQLSGEIPEAIGNLVNLMVLYLSDNQLSGEIPEAIGNLVNLMVLYLYNNQLSGAIPEAIGNLTNLTSLYLYNNQLSGAIPKEIGNLVDLQCFCLSENRLSGAIPKEIGNLVNLMVLYLYNNQLSGAIPEAIGNLTNLTSLYLSDNQLSGAIPKEIGNLVNLQLLSLYDNQLTGAIPKEIGNLVNLQLLSLYDNQLTGAIPEALWGLRQLTTLNLHGNALFGQQILTNQRTINNVSGFFSVQSLEEGPCNITVGPWLRTFHSHFTDEGVWQNDLIERNMQTFTTLTPALQALFIAELANYGYAQQMVFTFPDNLGTLTIRPAVNGSPRAIETSEGAPLDELVEALNERHMRLADFIQSAETGHPVGLIYPPSRTKSACNMTN